jgi:hypothetical protein
MALAPINPLHKERSLYLDLTCHPGDLAIPNAIFLTLPLSALYMLDRTKRLALLAALTNICNRSSDASRWMALSSFVWSAILSVGATSVFLTVREALEKVRMMLCAFSANCFFFVVRTSCNSGSSRSILPLARHADDLA